MLAYFVSLDPTVQKGITAVVGVLLALGINFLIGVLPWLAFLKNYQEAFSAALSLALIDWLQNIIPSGFEDLANKGLAFLLALIFIVLPYLAIRHQLAVRNVRGFA